MSDSITKLYYGKNIDVTFDPKRCIHAAECVNNLPEVFDTSRRPWILTDNADAGEVAQVVVRCPTGALHFIRKDGGKPEAALEKSKVMVMADGPPVRARQGHRHVRRRQAAAGGYPGGAVPLRRVVE